MAGRVLVVEDDESVAATLRAILEGEGYQVDGVASVPEALAKIERTRFDLALIDLGVGEADGLALLKRLNERAPGTARLILTGYGSLESAIQALRAGADDFLPAPRDVTELKASIARALHWRARVDELSVLNAELSRIAEERDAIRQVAEERAATLEQLDRLKDEFIITASHDLKTPLTAILGYAQYVGRSLNATAPDLDKVALGLATIGTQAHAMADLLDDLLDASRLQLGPLELRTAPCELEACLDTVLARLSPEERGRLNVALPDAPLAGEWDRKRIEQVLANLVGNALKYSRAGQRVSVAVERRAAQIAVAVTDRGMGISASELPRLFQRFYRTPQAHASGLAGTGLGLYICAGIIAAHGGRLWAESPGAGLGATFRFTLPDQAPSGADPHPLPLSRVSAGHPLRPPTGGERVGGWG